MVYVKNGNRLNKKKIDELTVGPYEIQKKCPTQSTLQNLRFYTIVRLIFGSIRSSPFCSEATAY